MYRPARLIVRAYGVNRRIRHGAAVTRGGGHLAQLSELAARHRT